MKKLISLLGICVFIFLSVNPAVTCFAEDASIEELRGTKLYVYNWGEYISDGDDGTLDVNAEFENKYGIEVVYSTFDNNESMYARVASGGVSYDVVIPSDYMIERMIKENMLEKIDFSNIPNFKYIDEKYRNLPYDPTNEYSVPYNVGMVGLIYNTSIVTEPPTSWNALWDSNFSKQILMFNNPRDAFAIGMSVLGIDYNTDSADDLKDVAELLKKEKPVLQSYVNDEVFNKMESGEAALAPYYAGDFLSMKEVNDDLAFVYPDEGVNSFVDAMCILKNSENKRAAELYINFMLEADVALNNAEYICYASPNTQVINNPEYEYYKDEILYPSKEPKTQIFKNLSDSQLALMNKLWDDVKSYRVDTKNYTLYLIIFLAVCFAVIVYTTAKRKYRNNY